MPAVSELTRRFHVGDLLAAVMRTMRVSPRGFAGVAALRCYMAGRPPTGPDDTFYEFLAVADDYEDDLAAAVLAAYPEFGTFAEDVPPPQELVAIWLRRREREFGRYLPAPMLPAAHPLRGWAPDAPWALARPGAPPAAAVRLPGPYIRLSDACTRFAACADPVRDAASRDSPTVGAVVGVSGGLRQSPGRVPRQFHIGDLLTVVMDCIVSPRFFEGAVAVLRGMADQPVASSDVFAPYCEDFRAAILATYPTLGAYTAADAPPHELLAVWLRRREREFGRYLLAPQLSVTHPLRVRPRAAPRAAPVRTRGSSRAPRGAQDRESAVAPHPPPHAGS